MRFVYISGATHYCSGASVRPIRPRDLASTLDTHTHTHTHTQTLRAPTTSERAHGPLSLSPSASALPRPFRAGASMGAQIIIARGGLTGGIVTGAKCKHTYSLCVCECVYEGERYMIRSMCNTTTTTTTFYPFNYYQAPSDAFPRTGARPSWPRIASSQLRVAKWRPARARASARETVREKRRQKELDSS